MYSVLNEYPSVTVVPDVNAVALVPLVVVPLMLCVMVVPLSVYPTNISVFTGVVPDVSNTLVFSFKEINVPVVRN
jgi:hypothetical protein